MQAQAATRKMTLDEYLDFERTSKTKHEFHKGKLIEMPYAHPNHGTVCANLGTLIGNAFSKKNTRHWLGDRWLFSETCDSAFYPDVLVVEGEPEYRMRKNMYLTLNPTGLIEVLSDTTEDYDRFEKWLCYKDIPSLRQYLMVSPKYLGVFSLVKKRGDWVQQTFSSMEDKIDFLGVKLSMKALYQKVDFSLK